MQPSSQSSPQRWNLLTPKINGKFDFRSACRKIPKTTAFILILTLILGISYMIPIFFSLAWNLIPQSGIYLYKVEFTFSTHQKIRPPDSIRGSLRMKKNMSYSHSIPLCSSLHIGR